MKNRNGNWGNRHALGSTLALAALLGGCSGAPAAGEPGELGQESAALWTNSITFPGGNVDVCFKPGGTGTSNFTFDTPPDMRARIQNLVMNRWGKAANIDFWGWGTCTKLVPTVGTIVVDIENPFTGAASFADGRTSIQSPNAFVAFRNRFPSDKTILHEFGLALGFQTETQTYGTCSQRTSGGTSVESQGDLADSVMSDYTCPDTTNGNLSNWDLIGARQTYGLREPGSIVGLNGLTLAIAGGSLANGASIVGWPVNSNYDWHGSFLRDSTSTLLLRAKSGSTKRCLNINGGTVSANFTPLIGYDCLDVSNERFEFTGMQWLAMGNRCVQAASSANGAKLSIQECSPSADSLQRWDFFENNTMIRLHDTALCVQIPSSSTALGTQPKLGACINNTSTAFSYDNALIRFTKDTSRCLAVLGGLADTGAGLALWDGCGSGAPNEQFTIRGPVHAMGQCLTMSGDVPSAGVAIGVYPCVNGNSQTWEYVW